MDNNVNNSVAAGIIDNAINKDRLLNGVDLKGIEVQITQHYTNELENLRIKYNAPEDCDYHTLKACELFGTPYECVTLNQRRIAKERAFGALYGGNNTSTFKNNIDSAIAKEIHSNCNNNDFESDHLKADRILCKLLMKLGYTETVEAFNSVQKWY